jgi:hypothetical protein
MANSLIAEQRPVVGRKQMQQIISRLRLGDQVEASEIITQGEELLRQLAVLRLMQVNLLRRVQTLHRRGMVDGYTVVRLEDVIACIADKVVEVSDEQ